MMRAALALLTFVAIGAIAGDVLAHPRGTATAAEGINRLLATALHGAAGRI